MTTRTIVGMSSCDANADIHRLTLSCGHAIDVTAEAMLTMSPDALERAKYLDVWECPRCDNGEPGGDAGLEAYRLACFGGAPA